MNGSGTKMILNEYMSRGRNVILLLLLYISPRIDNGKNAV
jgi:hypothetical protein